MAITTPSAPVAPLYTFNTEQGATFRRKLTWSTASGIPINLSGSVLTLQIKSTSGGSRAFTFSTESGHIALDPMNGIFILTLSPQDTEAFTFVRAKYQLAVQMPNNDVKILLRGDVVNTRKFS